MSTPLADAALARAGLVTLATALWPGTRGEELPQVAGFVTSAFSPLVAAVADLCLADYFGTPPADTALGERTAIVVASSTGDLATSAAIATAVLNGQRVPPLLFYQSNPNAVAGYLGARWALSGPVVCTMPGSAVGADRAGTGSALALALAEGTASGALVIDDGDADAALVVAANAYLDGTVEAMAVLIGPPSWERAVACVGARREG